MHYNWQPLFFSFLLPSLFGNDNLASGGRIPSRTNLVRLEDAGVALVEVPILSGFAEYVCPDFANNVRRQDSGATTVAIPKDQLQEILLQIQQMELTILALINQYMQDGELDSSDLSGVFAGDNVISISSPSPTSLDLGSLSSAVGSILSGMPAVTTNLLFSTTTLLSTITVTAPAATQTGFPTPGNDTNVAANSTAVASAAASSTTLISAAASSTTVSDSGDASATSLNGTAAPTSISNGGIFAQTSLGSAAAPTFTGGSSLGTGQDSTAGYIFNAQSSKNVAVYFGQTPVTGGTTLAAQCADPNIDIMILAFVISTSDGGQYPQINFGAACGGQTAEMTSKAPGLLSCPALATDITTCQSKYGKKVLLSIGGATSQISFQSASSASTFATTLWNLFGPPGSVDAELRPFGTVQIDGFDVDNEDNLDANWDTFAQTLRTHYAAAKSKTYYLSSAPQCPFPDASNPQALLLLCDFVWVQFYNNPQCQIGGPGFTASVKQWSTALALSTMAVKPRMYLGAPAFSAAGSMAYAAIGNAQGMQTVASNVAKMGLSNFGGVMVWDGPEGMLNTADGKDILGWAKAGLNE